MRTWRIRCQRSFTSSLYFINCIAWYNITFPETPSKIVLILSQNLVRFHYWQVKGDNPVVTEYSNAAWDAHVDHCFEYLRQAISCGSAFAIEGHSPLVVEGEHGEASTVTGWGIKHNCINFEALRTFQIEQERMYNSTWQT